MTSREKFEAWAKKEKLGIAYGDCGYVFSSTEMAWRAWQYQNADLAVQLANAESKCRELAAENGRCKFEISRCHQTVDEMFKNRDKWVDKEWLSAIWSTSKRLMNETPATDAFLAEVRAQGVEMFAKNAEGAEQGNGLMKAIARRATKFADQLRKGAVL